MAIELELHDLHGGLSIKDIGSGYDELTSTACASCGCGHLAFPSKHFQCGDCHFVYFLTSQHTGIITLMGYWMSPKSVLQKVVEDDTVATRHRVKAFRMIEHPELTMLRRILVETKTRTKNLHRRN